MSTFSYAPDYGIDLTAKPRTISVKFGDGYEQRIADGINTNPEKWSLTFSGTLSGRIAAILAFVKALNGVDSFDWTSPAGTTGKFKCQEYGLKVDQFDSYQLTAQFEQVFE
jgi:phage-related protein